MPVTVREIAREANVSIGTVSRALRNHPTVSPEHLQRVHEAVRSLNYRPLRNASKQSETKPLFGRTIALVLLGIDKSLANLPVVALAIHGAEAAITAAGGTLLFADVPTLEDLPKSLTRGRVDGVILKGALQGDAIGSSESLDALRRLPSVWLLGRPHNTWGDCIAADDFRIGRLAAEHLIARGHRCLAFLNPKPDHVNFARREASFVWYAQQTSGVTVQRFASALQTKWELPLRPAEDVACVQELVDALLNSKERPTAVFTPGDSIAALVYRALAAHGLKAREHLSVISANNEQSITRLLHPSLTTIDVHAEQVGRRAVDQLTWRLANRNEPNVEITIEPELIAGDSVAELGDSRT